MRRDTARRFKKRIDIWETLRVKDGFGGNTNTEVKIASTWADIETLNNASSMQNNKPDFGVNDPQNSVKVTVRKRNDLTYSNINMFIIYAGFKYFLKTSPINVGFNNSYIEFVAVREATKSSAVTPPIGGGSFPYTLPFILRSVEEAITITDAYQARVWSDLGLIDYECTFNYVKKLI